MTFYKDHHIIKTNFIENEKFDKQKSLKETELLKSGKTTPLHIYCEKNDFNIISNLLILYKDELNVNKLDYNGNSPFHCIFNEKYLSNISIYIIEFLLLHNGNIDITNKYGQTPLHLCCKFSFTNITEFLIYKKCQIDIKDKFGKTPLMYACEFGQIEQVITLIENNADVNVKDSSYKPLHILCLSDYDNVVTQINIAHLLIDNDADINIQHSCFLYTPLHCAVMKDNIYLTEFLLHKGANPNIPQILGNIPLHIVSSLSVAEILIKYKSKLHHKNDINLTPILLHKQKNNAEIYEYLSSL
tara:strand:- start:243 stop:1145 length:903 start_codon:yes stop_codon:yes gene_type:complete